MNAKTIKSISSLHFITHPLPNCSPTEQALQFLQAGGNWVQLRMKEASEAERQEQAQQIAKLKDSFDFTFIVNDHPELARQCAADGVHLGKQDCSPTEARQLLGEQAIIGATANTFEDIQGLASQPVNYIGLGPFRFTSTKKKLSPVLGLGGYLEIREQMRQHGISIPLIGIGGLTSDDVPELLATGLHGLAVSSAILNAKSIAEAAQQWLQLLNQPANHSIIHS